ncbi:MULTISPECIES: NAD(+) synthase [unclassified Rhizobium]|uniref:NAD(+) synthase n=1 Tax=unclassified Rhizobium TaxID=2613769 RepID=UPI0024790966|nr:MULTISPECIES: NAD(+) synthase [unclassified Rhizobium]MDH7803328.1 NAD+ synthase [Rhizobium sp. AN70]
MTNNAHSLPFSPLELDAAAEVERIAEKIRKSLRFDLRKRGLVLGISGGIDSSVCAALAVHALGAGNVIGLFMPENDSDPESLRLGQALATKLGMDCVLEDIGPSLAAMGCYERRDGFIREVVPEYGPGWASKIVFDNAMSTGAYNISSLVVRSPSGETRKVRLSAKAYLGIVAATNMKQRTRKQFEYYHADRLNFAVLGTPNRLEYDQGFFVKNGDGAADIKPIAHLYKSQVYQLAAHLGVPQEIRSRPPTTDTYSMPQTQEEFYFALPYDKMDICLYGLENSMPVTEIATATGLSEDNVRFVWTDIAAKRKVAHYLHHIPIHFHEGVQVKA